MTRAGASTLQFVPLGDSAMTISVGHGISRELTGRVLQLAERMRSAPMIGGMTEVVPSYASLTVFYDPLVVTYSDVLESARRLIARADRDSESGRREKTRTVRIPVRYDGEDLAEVATRTGHTAAEVVRLHTEREYHVYVVGFVPGFAYLGELHPSLVLPRRTSPRQRVPAGSVAVAEAQTGIYPFATPGGWHIIGTTDVPMFDPSSENPALLHVGDIVVFEGLTG